MPEITPEQALNHLNHAAGLAPLTREQHVMIQLSYQILKGVLKSNEKKDEPESKKHE